MSTEAPRVSAIVSTYRGERFLEGCLEDLVAQSLFGQGELEIVIIDSASPENEGAIAMRFQKRHPTRIRYHRTENRESLYAAWNRAIPLARGDYLTNANVDDRHHPGMLARLAAALDEHPRAAVVYADAIVTADANAPFHLARPTRIERWPDYDRDALFTTCTIGQAPLWRRSLHARYGMFNPEMRSAGDYEFWLRLAAAGEQFLHIAEPLGVYLERADALSLSNLDLSWHESEAARDLHWNPAWGSPPKLRKALPVFETLRRRVAALPSRSRIALYGAGKHTHRMLPLFRAAIEPHASLVGILDDSPAIPSIGGTPVAETADWPRLAPSVILISSDRFEQEMSQRAADQIPLPIWTLYASETPP